MADVKLWHDDVRTPPDDSWIWARTNDEAQAVFEEHNVTHVSLDHDLGNHELPPDTSDFSPGSGMPQRGLDTGLHLVRWMVEHSHFPGWIRVHAWNPSGGRQMYEELRAAGATHAVHSPYRHGEVLSL